MAFRDYRVGDWRFSPVSGELAPRRGGGTKVRLEPKVAAVLACLLQQPGRVVAKETLIGTVWPDTFVTDSAVFRHVSELRRLLGDDARKPRYIETVPKRGYRLVATVARLHEPPDNDRAMHAATADGGSRARRRRGAALAAAAIAILFALPWMWRPAAAPSVAAEISRPRHSPAEDPVTRETLAIAELFEDRVDCASYAKAGELLRAALEREGGLPAAYANIVDVSVATAVLGCRPTRAALDELEASLQAARAARLDAAQQQRALGHLRLWRDRDPGDAGLAFERVRQLAPAAAGSDMGYAAALTAAGRLEEAIAEGRRSLRDEPTHPGTNWALGMLLYFDGRLDEATEQLRHTLELHPGFAPAQNLLALVLLRRGNTEAALAALPRATSSIASQDRFGTIPVVVFAAAGDIASATGLRDAWERRARNGWVPGTAMAIMYDGLGERARAIEWLERALEEGDAWSVFLPIDPTFAKLREDPSFPELDSPSSSEKAVAARRTTRGVPYAYLLVRGRQPAGVQRRRRRLIAAAARKAPPGY